MGKIKGKGNTHVSSFVILGPEPIQNKKLERNPQPKAQFVYVLYLSPK